MRTDVERQLFGLVLVKNGVCGTDFFALFTSAFGEIDTFFVIDGVFQRYGLRIGNIYGLALGQTRIVFTGHLSGALLRTRTTGDALIHIHITGMLGQ
jgi:hypothetical protein